MKRVLLTALIILIVIITSIYIIKRDRYIEVGVVADISGNNSALGIAARNGVLLAIEEINNGGGVKGRMLRLHIKDHKGSKELCKTVTKELVNLGVQVVIGPTLSGMAESVIDGAKGSDTLVIGPTVSADYLKGIDDNFLRISSPSSLQGKGLASIMLSEGQERVSLIIDHKNKEYADGVVEGFRESITETNLSIIDELYYSKTDQFDAFMDRIASSGIDSLLFITNGVDAGDFIQRYNKKYTLPRLYGSGWNKVGQMEKYGGRLIEGMIFVDNYRPKIKTEKELEFTEKYKKRFHIDSNTVVMFYYEALYWFYQGIISSDSLKNSDIKQGIINLEVFNGIYEDYSIDEYGDGVRKVQNFIYRDGIYDFY